MNHCRDRIRTCAASIGLRKAMWLAIICALVLAGCDPGSQSDIRLVGDTCQVSLRSNAKTFEVAMELACDANGLNCHEITALSCQGADKPDAVPIDLTVTDGCPGADYCIDSCSAGLQAPGTLWDMPSLLAVDGCNVYQDGPTQ